MRIPFLKSGKPDRFYEEQAQVFERQQRELQALEELPYSSEFDLPAEKERLTRVRDYLAAGHNLELRYRPMNGQVRHTEEVDHFPSRQEILDRYEPTWRRGTVRGLLQELHGQAVHH